MDCCEVATIQARLRAEVIAAEARARAALERLPDRETRDHLASHATPSRRETVERTVGR